jgi:hypothetical protein
VRVAGARVLFEGYLHQPRLSNHMASSITWLPILLRSFCAISPVVSAGSWCVGKEPLALADQSSTSYDCEMLPYYPICLFKP